MGSQEENTRFLLRKAILGIMAESMGQRAMLHARNTDIY